jgi:hypothetical protein
MTFICNKIIPVFFFIYIFIKGEQLIFHSFIVEDGVFILLAQIDFKFFIERNAQSVIAKLNTTLASDMV